MRLVVSVLALTMVLGCATVRAGGVEHNQAAVDSRAQSFNHYIRAIMLQREGKYEKSLDEMRQALDYDPDSLPITLRLVWGYYRLEDYENALDMCQKAQKLAPKEPGIWTLMGRIYEKLDRYDDAADAFRHAAAMSPDNTLQYEAVIDAEEHGNDTVGAIEVYERLLKMHPDNAQLQFRLGLTLVRINDLEEARPHLEKALTLAPDLTRAKYVLGLVYYDLEDYDHAAKMFRLVRDKVAEFPNANKYLAGALLHQGRLDDALEVLKAHVSQGEANAKERLAYMYLCLRAGHYDAAAAAVPPNHAPIIGTILRAMVRQGKGEPVKPLLETLDKITGDVDHECQEYLNDLVFVFGEDDVSAHFLPSLEKLRQLGIQSRNLDLVYVRTLMGLDRNDDAEKVLQALLKRNGSDFLAHTYLSTIYEQANRFKDAEKQLQACLRIKPDDHNTMNTLGYLYAEHNTKLDEAEKLLQKALELDPGNPYYLDSLGWVYYRKGDADKAVDYIRRAIYSMDSDDPILREHLGDAYLLKGDKKKAISEWERSLRLDPDLKEVKEKLDRYR